MVEFVVEGSGEPSSIPKWFEQWARVADEPELTFVLPDHGIRASALVVLAAMTTSRRMQGLENKLTGDPNPNPNAWFMILFGAPGFGFGIAPRRLRESLQSISDLARAHQLAEEAATALTDVAPSTSPSAVRMARFVFEELGANIVQHSGRADTGFGFMRVDARTNRFELAFADAGVGIRESLQRNPDLEGRVADDAEALQLALAPRVTGTAGPRTNMGIGLKLLTDFSDLLNGDLWIASGSAMLQRRTTAGQRTNSIRSIPPWQGTWICLDAPVA